MRQATPQGPSYYTQADAEEMAERERRLAVWRATHPPVTYGRYDPPRAPVSFEPSYKGRLPR